MVLFEKNFTKVCYLSIVSVTGSFEVLCTIFCNNGTVWRKRKLTRCNNQMFIINFCLNMFRASLCPSSGEQRPCVAACGVLRWFCWMWLVAVVGRCGLCSPEDGHKDARNMLRQKLIINIWLLHLFGFLSLHTLLTMHGHRNLKKWYCACWGSFPTV